MTGTNVVVRPSVVSYLIFTSPIFGVLGLLCLAKIRHGASVWPVTLISIFLVLTVTLVIWSNKIDLRNDKLSWRCIFGKKVFNISNIQINVASRSRSDQHEPVFTKAVGLYLEISSKAVEGPALIKNIKVFDRDQLAHFLRLIHGRGVPVNVDAVSSSLLGLKLAGEGVRDN